MKKFLFAFVFLCYSFAGNAQNSAREDGLQLVLQNKSELGLTNAASNDFLVSDAYFNNSAGTFMVYLQQAYAGVPVYNQLQVVAFKNGKVVSKTGSFIEGLQSKVNYAAANPLVTPEAAVTAAIADRKLSLKQLVLRISGAADKVIFSDLGVSRENVTAQLTWVPLGKQVVRLAWQVYLIPTNSSDYWMVRVDAGSTQILGVDNYTVYCNWDLPGMPHPAGHCDHQAGVNNVFDFTGSVPRKPTSLLSPSLVNNATYRVVPFPAESPSHPGGAPALVANPWNLAPGNATTVKWHNNGTTDFVISRGNNVHAQEDRNNNNGTGTPATSTTNPDPLTFDFTPSFTVNPTQTTPVQNQQFNITNLFYWNNIIHDLSYQYGFDEVSGNFQNSNLGRGGAGTDYVFADAQDGGGTNNANFATPADGNNPRMQMYLWSGSPQKDGDVDNGVVCHEYAHGISTRLTGGPSNSGCLSNPEQMGEGWSDYFCLMYTQNWATATLNTGFSSPRGIGTYAAGQTPSGTGIRSQKYCTNFAVNNQVYAPSISASQHNRGEIWCATLWDMTWNIINQVGTINSNIFDPNGAGGNSIALKLVIEGMKLQPCSPGFIDGRNGILQADQILYGGAYSCAIREAFRRRGMGAFASQGSSSSVTDQIPDFTGGGATLVLLQNGLTQVPEGDQITYTNRVTTTDCAPLNNVLITDTLPSNVTWISGGNYNSTTRVVSFNVTVPTAQTQDFSFTVQVNAGAYFPTVSLFEDNVPDLSIPSNLWTTSSTTAVNWVASNARSRTAPNSYYSFNQDIISDQRLFSTNALALGPNPPPLTFWHWYSHESTYDGGVLEISTNGGTSWADVEPNIILGGYTGTMDGSTVLAGRRAWTGSSNNTFIRTRVNLTPYANQSVKFRFRFTSDLGTNLEGWYIDDIAVKSQAVVEMRSSMFTPSGLRVAFSDSIAIILPPVTCSNVTVVAQPVSAAACVGTTATFTVSATGDSPQYQWQVSTNGGTTWTNIAGQTNATLSLPTVTQAQSGTLYQVLISNACPSNITSTPATLTVGTPAAITSQPTAQTVCAGSNATFTVGTSGAPNTYQWQVSTDGGVTFNDIPGETTTTLTITSVSSAFNANQYHLLVGSCSIAGLTSSNVTLTVNNPPAIASQPSNITVCEGGTALFTVNATGADISFQWQVSTNGGTTFTPIPGATTNSYTVTGATAVQSGNQYSVVVTGSCPSAVTTTPAILTVSNNATIISQPVSSIVCVGATASFSANASGITYQWQVSTDNGVTFTDVPGATGLVLDITNVMASMNGYQYHLVVGSCTTANAVTNNVTLTVNEPVNITGQPSNAVACAGDNAVFTVSATGTAVTYQWEVSTDNGISFTPIPGANSPTLTVTNVTVAMNNYRYRVVLTNSCTNNFTSVEVTLTVTLGPNVVTNPSNSATCLGTSATFDVTATGADLNYQWQVSTDGGVSFTNITNANNVSLSFTNVSSALNNNQYRVVISNSCATTGITSTAATLFVNDTPLVQITAAPYLDIPAGEVTTLTATATPPASSFIWYLGGVVVPGASGNTLVVNSDQIGQYTASAIDANNCVGSSNAVKIGQAVFAFITPNPNNGNFIVRVESIPFNNQARYITMYDAKGARVYSKAFFVTRRYGEMIINASNLSAGTYFLLLSDAIGNVIGSGKVVVRF